jgi:hypothetical protein
MASSEDEYIALLANIPVYLYRYVGIILYFFGNVGNLWSIFVFVKKTWRKNVCSFYFVICLISSTIFLNSTMLGAICISAFNISIHNYSTLLCKLLYYVSYLFGNYLAIIFILASIDRLLISSQNVDTRLYSSKRLAYFSVSTSFLICSTFSLHVLIKIGIQEIFPTFFICYYEMSNFYLDFFSYSGLVISMAIPLIMLVLSILAFKNVRRIRAVPRQQRKQIRSMTKKDFQLLRCLYIHNIVYIITTLLLSGSVVYSRILKFQTYSPKNQAIDMFLTHLGSFVHYIPHCSSFVIFASMSKAFRQELKRGAYRMCGKDPTVVARGEDENIPGEDGTRENAVAPNAAVSTIDLRE